MGTNFSMPVENALMHHGIKGQKCGVRRFRNEDGSLTEAGKRRYATVFVSGSSKTQTEDSPYRRDELPKAVQDELNRHMSLNSNFVVGDAPGIDRQVQDYLNRANYSNVSVYGPGTAVRYQANKNWKTHPIDAPEYEVGSKEWLAAKDIAMEKVSTEGLAVVLDEGAKATRKNVERLVQNGKTVMVYELNKNGSDYDRWLNDGRLKHSDYLMHHGIKGQKWGIRRFQNPDGSLTDLGKKRYGTVENFNRAMEKKAVRKRTAAKIGIGAAATAGAIAGFHEIGRRKNEGSGLFNQTIKGGKDKPNKSPAEKITSDASKTVSEVSRTVDAVHRIRSRDDNRSDPSVSSMSDAELRRAINRINLEKQYASLTRKETSDGYQKVKDILDVISPVVGVTAGVVGIVSTVNGLKVKHEDASMSFDYDNYLMHHGIKGMRWGVHRFQNYDGTYTQKGVARYREKDAEYEKAVRKKKEVKSALKLGEATKQDYRYAKGDVVKKKNAVKLAYKKLKNDKLADQGKKMYREGKRIRVNNFQRKIANRVGVAAAGAAYTAKLLHDNGQISYNTAVKAAAISAGAAISAQIVSGAFSIRNMYQNKRLSAYYSH